MDVEFTTFTSGLGTVCIAATQKGLVFLAGVEEQPDQPPLELERAAALWPTRPVKTNSNKILERAVEALTEYLDNLPPIESLPKNKSLARQSLAASSLAASTLHALPVDWDFLASASKTTPLKLNVWKVLATIPHGELWDYSRVARECGSPSAIRAVATAVGSNHLPLVIPCHRVIGKDGKMRGFSFRGKLETKRRLLAMETGKVFLK